MLNPTRVKAVEQLIQWAAKNPTQVETPNILLLGDMNSYAKEDPILALEKANYKVLLNDKTIGQGEQAYSYVFGVSSNAEGYGGAGNLDHAIADSNLYSKVKKLLLGISMRTSQQFWIITKNIKPMSKGLILRRRPLSLFRS